MYVNYYVIKNNNKGKQNEQLKNRTLNRTNKKRK